MRRFELDVNKTGHYYNGYDWSRGDVYDVTAPSGNHYELMSGYSARGSLLGYQIRITEAKGDWMQIRSFNEALKTINILEKDFRWNLVKIASEAFETYESLQGLESGGIGPQRSLLGIVRVPGTCEVAIRWKYQAECGLSDRIYHPIDTEIHLDYYYVSDGVLVKTSIEPLDVSKPKPIWSDELWSEESKAIISEFFKKYSLKNAI